MNVRVFPKPCYFAESVYLLYAFVNRLSLDDQYNRIIRNYRFYPEAENDPGRNRIQTLIQISQTVTADMDPESPRLRYFFERLSGTDRKTGCCLAQIMLVTISLESSEIDDFAWQLLEGYRNIEARGFKINDMNQLGLVLERRDVQEEPESLPQQLERLPCSVEAKWEILRVLTSFPEHLQELTELIRPVAAGLKAAEQTLMEMSALPLARWTGYFQTHTVDDFSTEIFNTTFLFAEDNTPHEIWLGIWNFNPFGAWSEWWPTPTGKARVAYIGGSLSLDLAFARKNQPDSETLCTMARSLGSKDKLEILRRCAQSPSTAAKLAAAMNLNSGTVSRNLYSLYKLGFLETRGDGERVNYVTRLDAIHQLFRWIADYIGGGS